MLDESRYPLVSDQIKDSLRKYVEEGTPTGGFLEHVLCNDLKGAIFSADAHNKATLPNIVDYIMWEIPMESQGSYQKVTKWIENGGLRGLRALKKNSQLDTETKPEL